MKEGSRLLALEGLRGIAAIMVVLYHSIAAFYMVSLFGPNSGGIQHASIEDNLYGAPFMGFFSGLFAVAIFFVLSGFVLSIGFFSTGNDTIVKKLAAKRYIRLMLPALVSVLIAFVLIASNLSHIQEAFGITGSTWLSNNWLVELNLFNVIQQGAVGIFIGQNPDYNWVLWTMLYEFSGSFLIFVVLLLFGKLKNRWIVYVALLLLTFQTWYLGFIIGMILADLYANKLAPFKSKATALGIALLVLGIFLGGYPQGEIGNSFYQYITIPGAPNFSLYLTLGASFVIIGILTLPAVSRLFERVSILGKYTFSLYLIHQMVIFTFMTGFFVWLVNVQHVGYHHAAIISILTSLPLIVLATYLFERFVDAPSIRLSTRFSDWLLKDK